MNETIAAGLQQPDGPVGLADGCVALVEMDDDRRCLAIIEADGRRREVCKPGGRPTGLALDGDGCFWVAGGPDNSLVRLASDGRLLQMIEGSDSGPFVLPHDLAFGPDGLLYMSDSGVRIADLLIGRTIRPDFLNAAYNGRIYQIDPGEGRVLRSLATGLLLANGIAFDSSGRLYYSEMLTGNIYRQVPGGRQEIFAHALRAPNGGRLKGPAGLAFDREDTLYCALYGQGDICLIDPSGKISGHIRTNGALPSNLAFTPDGKHLLITEQEHGVVERIPAPRPGLALHRPKI
ncbi:MAG: SMP-30/gluconolactonase/LRE family protein [Rhizobium sp.]